MNSQSQHDRDIPEDLARYARQIRFAPMGLGGQQELQRSAALIVGCGALGSVIAESLTRAGVGKLKIVDRDYLELHNLQRQVLYDEADVASGLPKAVAAANKLRAINSSIVIESLVADVDYRNIGHIADSVDVIVDGTDNFEVRFLLNDWSLEHGVPWIYGGCIGSEGQTMTIVPGTSACLHCLMADGPPPPGTTPGCDTAGILGPVVNIIASLESMEAIKILSGNIDRVNTGLTIVDLWSNRLRTMQLGDLPDKINCPACRQGQRQWLEGQQAAQMEILCGRDAVQIRGSAAHELDLVALEAKLSPHGHVTRNDYLLKFRIEPHELTIFADGRAIVTGTDDTSRARSLYAQWIGI